MNARTLTVALVLLLTLALSARAETGDPFADATPPEWTFEQVQDILVVAPPPFTQADVDAWVAEVTPVVERIAGRTFTTPPVVRVVTRQELAGAVAGEMIAHIGRFASDRTPEQSKAIVEQATATSADVAKLSFGLYVNSTHKLLIPAENYPGLLRLVGQEDTPVEHVAKAVLAHELTHALEDQVLGGIDLPLDQEKLLAFRAVMEGHAVHIAALAADELHIEDGQRAILTAMAPARIIDADPTTVSQREVQKRVFEITYRSGYRFMRAIAAKTSTERLWDVFAAPPVTVAEIEHPETYGSPDAWKWPGESVVFRELHNRLPDPGWKWTELEISAPATAAVFRYVGDAALRTETIQSIIGGGLSTAIGEDQKSLAFVAAFRLDDPSHGATVLRSMDEVTRVKYDQAEKFANPTPLERTDYDGVPADGATRTTYTITPAPGYTMDMVIINVWRGRDFVSCSTAGGALSDDDMTAVIRAALDAMNATPAP